MSKFFKVTKKELYFLEQYGFTRIQYQKANEMEVEYSQNNISILFIYDDFSVNGMVDVILSKDDYRSNIFNATKLFDSKQLMDLKAQVALNSCEEQVKIYGVFLLKNFIRLLFPNGFHRFI